MNKNAIRLKVQQAINKMPTNIDLKRYPKTSDGMGGYIIGDTPINVKTFNALLDNSKHSVFVPTMTEGGTVTTNRSYRLYAVYDPEFTILKGDFFIANGTTYTIKTPVNILNLDIYWECDLEVVE